MDFFVYQLFKVALAILALLPTTVSRQLVTLILKVEFTLRPHYRRVSLRNLELAFPGDHSRHHGHEAFAGQ